MSRTVKKGFTLVELLIVIVVIGILTVGMFIAASEMEATARATKIINDLKQLKTAAMSWYWDNHDSFIRVSNSEGYWIERNGRKYKVHDLLIANEGAEIKKYLGNSNFVLNKGTSDYGNVDTKGLYATLDGYSVYVGKSNTEYYVFYRFSTDSKKKDKSRLREKLKGRAKSSGLISYASQKTNTYNGENVVGMLVMTFENK